MLETAGTLCQAPVPALYPTEGTDASHSSAPATSFSQQSPDLGRLSGLMITLDKLLDPMDSMTKQPGGCLQTSAAIISFWKPTSSLELSGARPSPYCLWLLDGDVACRLWPGCQWTQLFELLPPNPDDACVLSATPAGVFNQDSLKTAVKYLIMPKYAWNCVGSRHLWAPTLDQGWGPKGGYDPPNSGHQVWQRREVHILEMLTLDLNHSSKGHPLSGPHLQCAQKGKLRQPSKRCYLPRSHSKSVHC